jgi:UPF0716 protein FxsA
MLARLAVLFILVPVLELAILVQLGRIVGLWPTLALVAITGLSGAALARAEGFRAFAALQRDLAQGRVPAQAVLDGLCILVGGAFLLTPGLLTDVAGFSLLLPPVRRWIQARARRSLEGRIQRGQIRVGFMGPDGWTTGSPEGPPREKLDPRHEIRSDPGEP